MLQTNKKYKIGDISINGELINITNEYYKWMCKNPLNNTKCRKCKLLPVCGGGCSGSAVEKYGDYMHENCFDMNIELFKKRIRLYYKQKYGGGLSE